MPDWPHAPVHQLTEQGAYIVTAGTYQKRHHFASGDRLQLLHDQLLSLAARYGWQLQAWAVFSNHYHFVALSPEEVGSLREFLQHLHSETARGVNRLDGARERRVWFTYWDTHLTYQRSYLARLRYVHENAVHHGLVQNAVDYAWCSARWFEATANPAFFQVVSSFKTDRLAVRDDFDVSKSD
jgi:putative transposase